MHRLARITRQRAFTLIELLVVILVVAVLLAVAAPSFLGQQDKAHDSHAKQTVATSYRSGKTAWVTGANAYPAFGSMSDAAGISTLFGLLKDDQPQFTFATSVSQESPDQVQVTRHNDQVASYAAMSRSGRVFCVQSVEQPQTVGAVVVNPGLYWSSSTPVIPDGGGLVTPCGNPAAPPAITSPQADAGSGPPVPLPIPPTVTVDPPGGIPVPVMAPISVESYGTYRRGYYPSVSDDGNLVTFDSNGVAFAGTASGIHAKNHATGAVTWVSRENGVAGPGLNSSEDGEISGDGRYVAFASPDASVAGDNSPTANDIFRRDLQTGETIRVSVTSTGVAATGPCDFPEINDDGNIVTFLCDSSLHADDTNARRDVYVRDIDAGVTRLVSRAAGASGAVPTDTYSSGHPAISGDGRYIAFWSSAAYLVPGVDSNHIYVRDLQTESIDLVSRNNGLAGAPTSPYTPTSEKPGISDDGRYVAWVGNGRYGTSDGSNSSNIVWRRDRTLGITALVARHNSGYPGISSPNYNVAMSGDGRFITWDMTGAMPGIGADTNGTYDVYMRDMTELTSRLISATPDAEGVDGAGNAGNGGSRSADITPDGRYVVFHSAATNLVPPAAPTSTQVYRFGPLR